MSSRPRGGISVVFAVCTAAAAILPLHALPAVLLSALLFTGGQPCFAQAGKTVTYDGTFGANKVVFVLKWQPDGKKVEGSYYLANSPGNKYRLTGDLFEEGKLSLTEFNSGKTAASTIWLTKTMVNGHARWAGTSFTTSTKRAPVVMEERRAGKS